MIIVGNPYWAATDPSWRKLLNFCVANQCYTGCPAPRLLPTDTAQVLPSMGHATGSLQQDSEWTDEESFLSNVLHMATGQSFVDTEMAFKNEIEWRVML